MSEVRILRSLKQPVQFFELSLIIWADTGSVSQTLFTASSIKVSTIQRALQTTYKPISKTNYKDYTPHGWETVCYSTSAQHCALFSGLNVTFVLIETLMTWTEAQSYCREHHTDLASVRNTAENQKVMDLVPAGQKVWIGLFRDSWKWSDGSDSSFRHWAPGQPDNSGGKEACVGADLNDDGTWWDFACDQNSLFVCYSPCEC
uniref:C-type lectin domain-containing protein n=1 Tax=Sparus aurata TaxID=8175 RepID=A0A671YZM0_SPAAU